MQHESQPHAVNGPLQVNTMLKGATAKHLVTIYERVKSVKSVDKSTRVISQIKIGTLLYQGLL
jgi:hypothetical protein